VSEDRNTSIQRTERKDLSNGHRHRGPPVQHAAAAGSTDRGTHRDPCGKAVDSGCRGYPNAREWGLDLKEIALAIRDEQSTTTELLQAIHSVVDSNVTAAAAQSPSSAPQPAYYPPPREYSQFQPGYQQPAQSGGGLQRFLGGRFGQAIVTGAGIDIGDDIVNSIFAQSSDYAQRSGWNRSKSGPAQGPTHPGGGYQPAGGVQSGGGAQPTGGTQPGAG
jgi:hypothetical protein